jgi:MbtH protein
MTHKEATTMQHEPDRPRYTVVRNREEQYSLWPAEIPPPTGWVPAGPTGTRDEGLDHIRSVWTDLRPASLRMRTEG